MCGIAGGWLAPGNRDRLEVVVQRLAHRGPDDHGVYRDTASGVVLVHTRLAIIDLSPAGHQPMLSPEGTVALVFNGEIYNYRELRAGLEADGVTFVGHSDTEVLLQLYLKFGVDALARLNGIFAMAIHDRRSGELLLARDAMGVKPLYVGEDARGIAFASEIKALLPLLSGDLRLDPVALHRYLTFLWSPGDGTPLAQVRRLAPGEAIRIREGRIAHRWRWYTPPTQRAAAAPMNEADAIAAVQKALRVAVERQLVADVPVGAFLSGGLDSSAVVAMACRTVPDLRCFTIEAAGGGDTGDTDDLPYARRVASHLGVALDVVQVDADRMASELQQMVWHLDEPLADPAPLNVLYIAQLARRNGIKVLLSGVGGDDLFSGYRRHLALRHEAWWTWLPTPARRGLGRLTERLDQRTATGRRLNRLFAHAGDRADERLVGYFAWARRRDLLPLYGPAMRAAAEAVDAARPMLDFLAEVPADRSRMERMLALEQRFFLADHNLLYTDKMSMATGVEVRVPFLDLDLVELAARLPDRFKQRGRVGKWVLKKALEADLPHDVIHRPKTGFGAPLRRWMRHDLREVLDDVLSEQSLRHRGLFEPTAVRRLIADNDEGRKDAAYTLLSLLCIEIWCRRFLDGPALPQPTAQVVLPRQREA